MKFLNISPYAPNPKYGILGSLTVDYQEKCLQPLIFLHFLCRFICFILLHFIAMYGII
jgi:hypothetical protein